MLVVLTVKDARTGAHHLDIPFRDNGHIVHTVPVRPVAFKRDTDDLHVVMGMGAESHASLNRIVIKYPQCAEMHSFRVVVTGKAETVKAVQPAMVRMPPGGSLMYNHIFHLGKFIKQRSLQKSPASNKLD
jgi:hypothetical protein